MGYYSDGLFGDNWFIYDKQAYIKLGWKFKTQMKASEIYEHLKYIREILLKAKSQFCNIKKTFKVNAPNILLKSYTKLLSKIGESINVYKKKNALQDWKPNQQHLSFGVCELEFSFKQAETMLNTLIKVTDSFQTRATSLIAVLVPIFLFCSWLGSD